MNIRMKRSAALILTAALLLAGSAQALFGLGKSKTDAPAPENAPTARDLRSAPTGASRIRDSWKERILTAGI